MLLSVPSAQVCQHGSSRPAAQICRVDSALATLSADSRFCCLSQPSTQFRLVVEPSLYKTIPMKPDQSHSGTPYRPEIDGLRAVAVIPVILFHAGVVWCKGGFLGVDVFFVISGYLITSIILGDRAVGKFSIATFYERRARRILPALFLVITVCIPFAVALMLPVELERFSKSTLAVLLFVPNVFFWLTTSYFDTSSQQLPLLHTWSLAGR